MCDQSTAAHVNTDMKPSSADRNDEDRRIVRQIRQGDTEAYAQLVTVYQTPIYNLMLRMTGSEDCAMDLTQETFIRSFEKLDGYDSTRNFFPWLYTLGMNVARDYLRRYTPERIRTRSLDLLHDEGYEFQDPQQSTDRAHDQAWLNSALEELPEATREALVMRFREGFSYEEIASALHLGLSNTKMKIHRGLAQLRSLLGADTL